MPDALPRCSACRYYGPRFLFPKCLRRAPVATRDSGATWPTVEPDYWCGEFEAKPQEGT